MTNSFTTAVWHKQWLDPTCTNMAALSSVRTRSCWDRAETSKHQLWTHPEFSVCVSVYDHIYLIWSFCSLIKFIHTWCDCFVPSHDPVPFNELPVKQSESSRKFLCRRTAAAISNSRCASAPERWAGAAVRTEARTEACDGHKTSSNPE